VAIGVSWLVTFFPSFLLAILVSLLLPGAKQPQFPFSGMDLFVRIVVVAPVLETLIMGAALLVLQLIFRPTLSVVMTAILAGLAHSFSPTGVAVWGLVIWWPFLIFATLFVVWRQRSLLAAFAVPAVTHALHNLPTAALIVSGIKV